MLAVVIGANDAKADVAAGAAAGVVAPKEGVPKAEVVVAPKIEVAGAAVGAAAPAKEKAPAGAGAAGVPPKLNPVEGAAGAAGLAVVPPPELPNSRTWFGPHVTMFTFAAWT